MIKNSGFPITERVKSVDDMKLPAGSNLMHSVVIGRNDNDLPEPPDEADEVKSFLCCRREVHNGNWPKLYFESLGLDPEPRPLLEAAGVSTADPRTASTLVDHTMDHPIDLHTFAVRHFAGKYKLKAERRPKSIGVDFLGARQFDATVTDLIHEALIDTFQAKYFFARIRPEHYFDAGPLVTEYPCPPHPAYPAGHGAIAGAIVAAWRKLVEAPDEVFKELEHAGRQYAHYRTLAGVHWPTDNTAGFDSGVATVERKLRD